MARVSQYKALGTKLGGYKSTLSKIQSKEYGKKHADWKAQEEISLYNEIGGTVANILGIAKESRISREQADTYAREYGIDPGDKFAKRVTRIGEEQNPFLDQTDEQFWADENMSDKIVGLPETPDAQPSLFEGKSGETWPINTEETDKAYRDSLISKQMPVKSGVQIREEEYLRKAGKQTDVTGDYERAQDQSGLEAKKRIEEGLYGKVMGDYDTMGGRAGSTAYKEIPISTPTIMSQEPSAYELESEALRNANSPYRQNPDDYEPSGLSPQSLPKEITDDVAFSMVKGEDDSSSIMSSAREHNIKKAIDATGEVSGGNVSKAFAMESTSGTDPRAKGNPFQIKSDSARADFESKYGKNYSIENSAKFYQETTKKNVGMVNNKQGTSFENFKFKSARLNKKFPGGANIFEGAAQAVGFAAGKATESHKGFVEYMTWQQGRSGTLDIISTTMGEGGKLNTKSRDYMLNNVSDSQRTTLKGLNDKELSKEWLKIQYKKWESK